MKVERYSQDIIGNCDNLEKLRIANKLISNVIGEVDDLNDLINEEDYYDLGNDKVIGNEDLESLVSITETIYDIVCYNTKEK